MVIEGQCLSLFILAALSSVSMAGENKFLPPVNSSCACPNQVLTFECTVVGSGATVWTGSAFSCDTNRNEITLRHNSFTGGTTDVCNGGAIIAESLHVIDDCFTSQLRVNVSNELNNKTVDCVHSTNTETVGQSSIFVTVISDLVPSGVQLTDIDQGQLTFTWYALSYNCTSLNYLASSNCTTWSCDVNTNTTTAVCSGLQLPSVCTFRVTPQTEVCGQMVSPSEPITVTLRVPDKLMLDVIPVYSLTAESQNLLQIKANIQQQASFNITDTVSGSTTKYSSTFSSDNPLTMSFNRNTSCLESTCAYLIDVPSDLCQSSSDISVAFSASNRLGKGPTTDSTTIGCTNQFVQVEYDRTMSTITCRFLDETDTSVKSCNVTYGQCGQELIQPGQLGNYSTMEAPNIVYIKLPMDAASLECYNVTASSDVFTVIIQALGSSEEKGTDEITVIVVTIVVLLFAIVVLVTVSIILVYIWILRRKKMSNTLFVDETHFGSDEIEQISMEDLGSESKKMLDIDQLDLQRVDRWVSTEHEVRHDCELRDFVENELKLEFKRGCAFYEFVHDFEDISEDKQVMFKDKSCRELFYPKVDTKSNPLIGRKIPKPYSENFQVFVQSTGSGARQLPAGSMLLYNSEPSGEQCKREPPLKLVISTHFETKILPNDVKIKYLCGQSNYSIFLELGTFKKTSKVIDVIWQDKKAERELYTGPGARKMVKDHYKECASEGFDKDKWRVFVLCKFDRDMDLKSGTNILQYEIPRISIGDFHVLTAGKDEECNSLSKFVEQKRDGAEFINGNAFYEFKGEEDLQYYKEVIFWETETDKLTSSIDLFYGLPGVPAVGVKPPRKEGVRVFIQSTSQGTRCVKPGDTILYKKKPDKCEPTEHKERKEQKY